MTPRVCYLSRVDGGSRLAEVRLLSERLDDKWTAGNGAADAAAVIDQTRRAAHWVGERLAGGDGDKGLRLLCLDIDGAVCSWLTAPGSEEKILTAAMSQGAGWGESTHAPTRTDGVWGAVSADEASVQALAPVNGAARRPLARRGQASAVASRLAVMAVPDVSARLFVDALDDEGVAVDAAATLWHAMAAAWDSPAGDGVRSDRVVATDPGVVAVVLVDPRARLIWSWSRAGELLAGGAIRLVEERGDGEHAGAVRITAADVGRLTADWLAWGAQLGLAPTRILCIGPDTGAQNGDSLSPAGMGQRIGESWAGATIDLAVHDDPVGATLRRLIGGAPADHHDPRTGLVRLGRRPGRMHRGLWRWTALGVMLLALCAAAVAWKAWGAAGEARQLAQDARAQARERTAQVVQIPAGVTRPQRELERALAQRRQALMGAQGLEPAKPILQELETLAAALGTDLLKLDELSLQNALASFRVTVPDSQTYEWVNQGLNTIGGSNVEWRGEYIGPASRQGGGQLYTFHGTWKPRETRQPGAPAGGGA